MSDFGAPEVNWRPLPRAARPVVSEASKASAAKQTSWGFGGAVSPPTGSRGGAPGSYRFSVI